jgi:hypothetical protein
MLELVDAIESEIAKLRTLLEEATERTPLPKVPRRHAVMEDPEK